MIVMTMYRAEMKQVVRKPVHVVKPVKLWSRGVFSSSWRDSEAHERQTISKPQQLGQQLHPTLNKVIRANQAGERAAVMICAGQIAILGKAALDDDNEHVKAQEQVHVKSFESLVVRRRVRPSLFLPFWEFTGFVLGAATAMLGKEAAMMCTVAVEDVIEQHYNSQLRQILVEHPEEKELLQVIAKCRDEELKHKDLGIHNNSEQTLAHEALTQTIKMGCKLAIRISEQI